MTEHECECYFMVCYTCGKRCHCQDDRKKKLKSSSQDNEGS